jgi:hypothetical protein
MEILNITKNEIYNLTVAQIDEIINASYDISDKFMKTKDIVRLNTLNEICGALISIRCEKLGIKI